MNAHKTSHTHQKYSVLFGSTWSFVICFAIWTMFSVLSVPLQKEFALTQTETGLLIAISVMTGALLRLPIGILTDRFGGRIVYFVLMAIVVVPLWMMSYSKTYEELLVYAFFVGACGASFSVGIAYTARWFEPKRQGLAMGIFGIGNAGAALTQFVAPTIVEHYGWAMVPKVYAIALAATALLFWSLTYTNHEHHVSCKVSLAEQLKWLKNLHVLRYSIYYSLVFGAFVGLALWMPKYYVQYFGFDLVTAGLLSMIFTLPSGIIRALGGWFSDRYGAHRVTAWTIWISALCLAFLSYPDFSVSSPSAGEGFTYDPRTGVWLWVWIGTLFVLGIAWGFGKASVFKYLSDEFPESIGTISGIVGLVGGTAGFLLPIIFGVLLDKFHLWSSAFMWLFGVTAICIVFMFFETVWHSYGTTREQKTHQKLLHELKEFKARKLKDYAASLE